MAKRKRSPNYPVVGLKSAIEYLDQLSNYAGGQHDVPVTAAIEKAWKMKEGSTYGLQVAAALKAFGLIEDKGVGNKRQVKVTDDGAKIRGGHTDRPGLLAISALRPPLHKELWELFHKNGSLAPDASLRQYLIFDREGSRFNENTVDTFIDEFKETVAFANLFENATIDQQGNCDPIGDPEIKSPHPMIGKRVQWVADGVSQFPDGPREVIRVDEHDGEEYGFVLQPDGSEGAFKMSEAIIEEPKTPTGTLPLMALQTNVGTTEHRWKLPSGTVIVTAPEKMTKKDFEIAEKYFDAWGLTAEDDSE